MSIDDVLGFIKLHLSPRVYLITIYIYTLFGFPPFGHFVFISFLPDVALVLC